MALVYKDPSLVDLRMDVCCSSPALYVRFLSDFQDILREVHGELKKLRAKSGCSPDGHLGDVRIAACSFGLYN